MTQALYSDVSILFLAGALLLLYGSFQAVRRRGHYGQLVLKGALADAGIAAMALGASSSAASNGALLFLIFQLAARGAAYAALLRLTPRGAAPTEQELRCIGLLKPRAGWIFSLALLAAVGGTPFFAPEGRFFAVQGIAVSPIFGHIWGPLLIAACSTVFVWLTIEAVQNVSLEQPHHLSHESPAAHQAPAEKLPLWLTVPAAAVALMGVFRSPLGAFTAWLTGAAPVHSAASHPAFAILYIGAGAVFVLGLWRRRFPGLRDKAAPAFMGLALLAVIFSGDLAPLPRLFALIICGIGLAASVYSMGYMAGGHRLTAYQTFFLLTFASMIGIVTTENLGEIYGFWELMTFASFFLVAHEANRTAFNAAAKYYIMCAGGAFVMLPGLALLGGADASLASVPAAAAALNPDLLKAALIMALAGFAVKAGLAPVHNWLPDAHPAAPSSISAPLSGVITKMGVFGIVVIIMGLAGPAAARLSSPEGFSGLGYGIAFMGGVTLVLGEIMALRQTDVKRMLAYSTIGQLGEITLVLGVGAWLAAAAALAHTLNHAIMKDLLFLGAGALILRAGSRNLADMAGMGRCMPFTVTCMGIGLISIMGLPPFAGFFSKYLMIQACINAGLPALAVFILGGSLIGAVYYTRILRVLVFEPRPAHLPDAAEAPLSMRIALGALAALCLLFGLAPQLPLALVVPAAGMHFSPTGEALRIIESVTVSWPIYVILPFFGALIPAIWRKNPQKAGWTSVGLLLATALLVLLFGRDLDTLSFSFALIVPLIGALNMAYAVGYMDHSHTQWRFYSSFCCICAGLIGVASSSYLFSFFLFWEIMSSWALYMALAHEGDKASMREAFKYFFFNVLGAAFIFVGVTVLGPATPLTAGLIKTMGVARLGPLTATAGVALLAAGFVLKAAQLPFRIDWQMHPALAPTPVSGFISSVLLKSAILGLVKLFLLLGGAFALGSTLGIGHEKAIMHIVMWIGGLTIIMASVQALMATNLKLVFIYSTVSQIGYMVLAVGVGSALGYAGGLLHVANHVFFKDLLFLVCGAIMFQTHRDNLADLGGIGRRMPVTMTMFAIAGLSVVGVPPTSGFTSKWIIYHALMEQGYAFLALLSLVGSVITLAYIAKFLHLAFLGQEAEGLEHVQEAPRAMRVPMIILGAGCVLSGVLPGLFLEPINLILKEYGLAALDVSPTGINSGPGAWNATAVFAMSALAFYGGWRFVNHFVKADNRATDVHTCGVDPKEAASRMNPASLYAGFAGLLRGRAASGENRA